MTDQPKKKTLEEAKVNEAKVLANDPLPAPFSSQKASTQMAFYCSVEKQSLPSQFYVFVLNLTVAVFHITKFPKIWVFCPVFFP